MGFIALNHNMDVFSCLKFFLLNPPIKNLNFVNNFQIKIFTLSRHDAPWSLNKRRTKNTIWDFFPTATTFNHPLNPGFIFPSYWVWHLTIECSNPKPFRLIWIFDGCFHSGCLLAYKLSRKVDAQRPSKVQSSRCNSEICRISLHFWEMLRGAGGGSLYKAGW